MNAILHALVGGVFASFALTQQTWKVACSSGPGVDFTNLQAAVNAASPGDTILLISGNAGIAYPPCPIPYDQATISKGINLVGVRLINPAPPTSYDLRSSVSGLIVVENIPAGQRFSMSQVGNSTGTGSQWTIGAPFGLVVRDCAGEVIIEDYNLFSTGFVNCMVRIERSVNVTLRGCTFYLGGEPLTIEDSNVLLTNTLVDHVNPLFPPPWGHTQTRVPGIRGIRSTMLMSGSRVEAFTRTGPFATVPGVSLDQSTLRVGPENGIYASTGGSLSGGIAIGFDPSPAGSLVEVDPRTQVVLGPIAPPVSVVSRSTTVHSGISPGTWFGLRHVGPPGGFSLMVFGDLLQTALPSPIGDLAFDPFTATALDIVALPATFGGHEWVTMCPNGVPQARPFVFQALTLAPNGTFGVSDPTPVLFWWQPNVIP